MIVIKGLIGLEYPPLWHRSRIAPDGSLHEDDYGPPISETIRGPRSGTATNLVHWDLDPQNGMY